MTELNLTPRTLAEASGVRYEQVTGMLALRIVPINKRGRVQESVAAVARFFNCDSEELFPPQHYDRPLEKNSSTGEMSLEEVGNFILENNTTPEMLMLTEQLEKTVDDAKKTRLTDRETKVLEMRLGGMTLQEVADEFGLCRDRIRQIEQKAHRKLRPFLQESARDIGLKAELQVGDGYHPSLKEIKDGFHTKNKTGIWRN